MQTIKTVIVQDWDVNLFFELTLIYDNSKKDRGFYLKEVPIELSEKGLLKDRYYEIAKIWRILKVDRYSETKAKTAIEKMDSYIEDLKKELEKNSLYVEEMQENIHNILSKRRLEKRKERHTKVPMQATKDLISEEKTTVKFDDVAGLKEVKEELYEIVDSVENKEKYEKMGAELPRGILFYGPPGTGKTLLVKALAGETDSSFFSISGSEFTEKYVGVGAKRVRDLFARARKKAPSIIFIDEIDAIGGKRNLDNNAEKDQTLNQLLTEMDGFKSGGDIIVIGATNRIEILDEALKRSGRFDKHIYIGNPDLESRKELFKIHTLKKPLDKTVDLEALAKKTHGFSGADIKSLTNQSALLAIREGCEQISHKNMEDALEQLIGGLKSKTKKVKDREKQIVSYHESGHALAGILLEVNNIQKISIIPSGEALGFVINLPDEDVYLYTKQDLENQIKILLAGRVAEEIKFGYYSTGASNDLKKATNIALKMVCHYGMDNEVGLISRDIHSVEKLTDLERESIKKILTEQYNQTKKLLDDNYCKLKNIANYLYENEEMDADDVERIIKHSW